jgi:SAM-dependent methyltransferase
MAVSGANSWVPADVDLDRPNAARMYDYMLGGAHNFEIDRDAANQVLAVAPEVRTTAQANRGFLRRAVKHAADNGVRQFIDLGSGIPTVGNVHEIAQTIDPAARIVYVDNEAVAVAHSRTMLRKVPNTAVIHADIRRPAAIVDHDHTRRLIDFDQPVAVLMVSVLHFIPGDINQLIAAYRRQLIAGSYLVISHASRTEPTPRTESVEQLYERTPTPLQLRTRDQIRDLFDGLHLVHPNPATDQPADLVPVTNWRPEPADDGPTPEVADSPFIAGFLAAVGRVPPPPTTTARAAHARNRTHHFDQSARPSPASAHS